MKKLIYGAIALATMAMAACGGNESSAPRRDIGLTPAEADSMVQAFGTFAGSQMGQRYQMLMSQDSSFSRDEILKGMDFALKADTSKSFQMGMQMGMQLAGQIKYFEQMGMDVNTAALVKSFRDAFMADSIDPSEVAMARMAYENALGKVREAQRAYEDSIKSATPESQANIAAGEAFLAKAKAEDPAVATTASGLGYKIEAAGEGDRLNATDRITMRYKGQTIGGHVFDETGDEASRSFVVGQLVPGMVEGLQMLGKGGKARFYIPGKLGYGPDGAPRAGIGPNEMLIFDVEVTSVAEPLPRRSPGK